MQIPRMLFHVLARVRDLLQLALRDCIVAIGACPERQFDARFDAGKACDHGFELCPGFGWLIVRGICASQQIGRASCRERVF